MLILIGTVPTAYALKPQSMPSRTDAGLHRRCRSTSPGHRSTPSGRGARGIPPPPRRPLTQYIRHEAARVRLAADLIPSLASLVAGHRRPGEGPTARSPKVPAAEAVQNVRNDMYLVGDDPPDAGQDPHASALPTGKRSLTKEFRAYLNAWTRGTKFHPAGG